MDAKYAVDPAIRALLADIGVSTANVLRRAQLPADLLQRGQVWLSEPQFFAVWRAIEDESGDPNLPLRIAEAFTADAFAPPIFAALLSPDLNTAARRLQTYKPLVGPMRLEIEADSFSTTITFVWPPASSPPPMLAAAEPLFWVALARAGTRHRVDATAMTMPEPPADVDAHHKFVGVTIQRSATCSVSFSAIDARRPFLTANDGLWQSFEPELQRRLSELEGDASTAERVRAVLLESLPAGDSAMSGVAGRLAMSTRTLHRRLQDEGTTFQRVLDATREALARHYLTNQDLSTGEISFLLGYAEPSSFFRAFHGWTGLTPDRVRSGAA